MPTATQTNEIIDRVEKRLNEAARRGVKLKVSSYKLDDDWLYVVVEPDVAGIRASDHADLMEEIERELRTEGIDQVLLVPAMRD